MDLRQPILKKNVLYAERESAGNGCRYGHLSAHKIWGRALKLLPTRVRARRAVYEGAVHLEELNILLGRSCQEYWEQRLQSERVERIKQIKEHWDSQCRAFMGV
ncbi:ubiquitin-protein ligase, putative [Medicago truncatula]|uniref:Ubiquitin-protein ligase, putative n=1 Tax=Medicago truncatula TaxID=3880 RepID=A0A072TPV2_MEDTR|nr:ubiquitin-protein ligase, putative [Medicago truncatula]